MSCPLTGFDSEAPKAGAFAKMPRLARRYAGRSYTTRPATIIGREVMERWFRRFADKETFYDAVHKLAFEGEETDRYLSIYDLRSFIDYAAYLVNKEIEARGYQLCGRGDGKKWAAAEIKKLFFGCEYADKEIDWRERVFFATVGGRYKAVKFSSLKRGAYSALSEMEDAYYDLGCIQKEIELALRSPSPPGRKGYTPRLRSLWSERLAA